MARGTILEKSGQQWKVYVGTLLMLTGVALAAFAPSLEIGAGWQLLTLVGGLTLGLGAGVWQVYSIRCPRCAARWLWLAVTQETAGVLLSGLWAPATWLLYHPFVRRHRVESPS